MSSSNLVVIQSMLKAFYNQDKFWEDNELFEPHPIIPNIYMCTECGIELYGYEIKEHSHYVDEDEDKNEKRIFEIMNAANNINTNH